MRTETINVYQYSELSEAAKEKAREWFRNDPYLFEYEAENIIYDVKEIANLFGLDIDKVYYSGFCSQGDGASFTGRYQYKKGALQAVKAYAPCDAELHRLIAELQNIQRKSFYGISCRIRQSGRYYHEMTMQFDIEVERQTYNGMEDDIAETMRDYARWIYKRLENGWDYVNSDEYVEESIIANDYEFLESGKRA